MSARPSLTDQVIEAMLTRRAARPEAPDLRDLLLEEVAGMPQVGRPWLRLPERPSWITTAPAWAVLGVLLLLALSTLAMLGARLLVERNDRTPLVSTGIESLRTEGGAYTQVVVDGHGVAWAHGEGILARLAPDARRIRTWTFADDAAFGDATDIAPAHDGGVWIVGPSMVRRFDGEQFAEVTPKGFSDVDVFAQDAGSSVPSARIADGPDGAAFAVSPSAVFRWDGTGWIAPMGLAPDARAGVLGARTIVRDPRDGSIWVANVGKDDRAVAHFDGTAWSVIEGILPASDELGGRALTVWSMAFTRDDTLWLADDLGLIAFDGTAARRSVVPGMTSLASIGGGPDGSLWVSGASTIDPGQVAVARYTRDGWLTFDGTDGLPAAAEGRSAIAATQAAVYLATSEGIHRFDAGRWERLWPQHEPGPGTLAAIVAVSADEAWAIGTDSVAARDAAWAFEPDPMVAPAAPSASSSLWHYVDGGWSREEGPPGCCGLLARTPDGTLLTTTPSGVFVRGASGWTLVRPGGVSDIAAGPDGSVYVSWSTSDEAESACHVAAVGIGVPGDGSRIPDPPTFGDAQCQLALASDGSIWATVHPTWGWGIQASTVAHFVDGRWTIVGEGTSESDVALRAALGGGLAPAGYLVTADDGTPWAIWSESGSYGGSGRLATFDGTWTLEDPPIDPEPPGATDLAIDGHRWPPEQMAAGSDGTVWVVGWGGQLSCRGSSGWTDHPASGGLGPALDAAPDGTLFVAIPGGVGRAEPCD